MNSLIIFDLDKTLVPELEPVREAFVATCESARTQYGLDPELLQTSVRKRAKELWRACRAYAFCNLVGISSWEGLWGGFAGEDENLQFLRAWAPEYRLTAWANALADHDVHDRDLARYLAETFAVERSKRHWSYPDAEPILEELRGQFRLAIITNGAPDIQQEKLDRTGLARYFDPIVISGTIGVGKPDSRIFHAALTRAQSPASRAVMIGDSLKNDIQGAQSLGIKGVWINRYELETSEEVVPDATIRTLHELPEALEKVGAR